MKIFKTVRRILIHHNIMLCCIILALPPSARAQTIRFTDQGNFWITNSEWAGDPCNYTTYQYFGHDTVLSGIVYKQMLSATHWSGIGCIPGALVSGSFFGVREDTAAGMVYYRSPADSPEHVLYNYNLNAGDLISYGFTVDSVAFTGSTTINGSSYKTITLTTPNGNFRNYCVVQGIGATNSPVFPTDVDGTCVSGAIGLCSFSQNGSYPVFSAPLYGYCLFGTPDTFQNSNACSPSGLAATNITYPPAPVTIYPVPATTELTISARYTINNLVISNLVGETVYTHEYSADHAQVDVSTLPAGIYFVKINGAEVRKFVKE